MVRFDDPRSFFGSLFFLNYFNIMYVACVLLFFLVLVPGGGLNF